MEWWEERVVRKEGLFIWGIDANYMKILERNEREIKGKVLEKKKRSGKREGNYWSRPEKWKTKTYGTKQ